MISSICRMSHRPVLALLALAVGFAAPARADQLDEALMKKSRNLVNVLREAGVKNVGVLKFQVEKGKDAPSYFSGRLNTLMATRLENLLVLAQKDDLKDASKVIGVTRAASEVAAMRDKDANYDDKKGRDKLFEKPYPLIWGKEDVAVDAFLTGVVKLSADYKETTVVVHMFEAKSLAPRTVLTVTVPTDRLILADMGAKFLVSRGELNSLIKVKLPPAEAAKQVPAKLDQAVAEMVRLEAEPIVTPAPPKDETLDQVLEFKIFYDGKEATRGADNRVATPKAGQKVQFTMKGKERIGVVLRVNGINTADGATADRDADQYAMWVLDPNKTYTIRGFYKDKKEMAFEVLAPDESTTYRLADESKRGQIELFLFRQVFTTERVDLPPVKETPNNFRQPAPRVESAAIAHTQVLAMMKPTLPREIIVPADSGKTVVLNTVPFNNVELTGHLTITYAEKK